MKINSLYVLLIDYNMFNYFQLLIYNLRFANITNYNFAIHALITGISNNCLHDFSLSIY